MACYAYAGGAMVMHAHPSHMHRPVMHAPYALWTHVTTLIPSQVDLALELGLGFGIKSLYPSLSPAEVLSLPLTLTPVRPTLNWTRLP